MSELPYACGLVDHHILMCKICNQRWSKPFINIDPITPFKTISYTVSHIEKCESAWIKCTPETMPHDEHAGYLLQYSNKNYEVGYWNDSFKHFYRMNSDDMAVIVNPIRYQPISPPKE